MALSSNEGFTPGYCEYLVPAKADKKVVVIRIAALLIGAALIAVFMGLLSKIPQVLFLWFVVVCGLEIIVFSKTKREFEYTIASGIMTVEIIYGKSMRKKLYEIRIADAETVTYVGNGAHALIGQAKEIYACNKNDSNMYVMIIPKADSHEATALYFSGCTKVLDCIKYYNRTCIKERKD